MSSTLADHGLFAWLFLAFLPIYFTWVGLEIRAKIKAEAVTARTARTVTEATDLDAAPVPSDVAAA